jgi:hypothetical protein
MNEDEVAKKNQFYKLSQIKKWKPNPRIEKLKEDEIEIFSNLRIFFSKKIAIKNND